MKNSIKILIALVVFNLFLGGMLLSRNLNSPINALINPKTRLQTYKDILKENQSELQLTDELYSVLFRKIESKDDPKHPYYLLLWEYRRLKPDRGMSFPGEKFREPEHEIITPPLEHPTATPAPAEYFMSLISHDGRLLDEEEPRPFGGYNLITKGDVIFDINQDRQVDWVSTRDYSQNRSSTSLKVIQVAKMNYQTDVQFRVAVFSKSGLTTAHPKGDLATEPDWSFQCVDENDDGLLDLQIGPGPAGSIIPKVTFFWNANTKTYESPAGEVSPFHTVMPITKDWNSSRNTNLTHPFDR